MKLSNAIIAATALSQCATCAAVPNTDDIALQARSHEQDNSYFERDTHGDKWKRKGGGGGGGRGGGGGSSGGSSGSGSSGSGSAPKGSSGSSGSSGSGSRPSYGAGGAAYSGGAKTPYTAGRNSPSGIPGGLLAGSAIGFLGAYWLVGAYHYPYHHPYGFYNRTTDKNETKPVECLCRADEDCGCDDNSEDTEYMNGLIGNGTYEGLDKSRVTVANANGTDTIFINGTLPSGTTADSTNNGGSNAAGGMKTLLKSAGWWPLAATALALAVVA
ncbi:hypothetical protein JX266_009256 [Neoarthrinium moseri]|nr:hypothetical protein JX266_009256 [Neoarthrinium moseri]